MNKWHYLSDEIEGVHPGKMWLTNGTTRALFKADTADKESEIEMEVYKIALSLGMPCAKIEVIEFDGKKGSISYDFKERDNDAIVYRYPDDLFFKSSGVTYASKDADGNPNERVDVISFEAIRNNIPNILAEVIDMIFLDCLVRNGDRHGSNWELIVKQDEGIIGIAPLFDHGKCLWIEFLTMDECRIPWGEGHRELTHFKMFENLCAEYPEQIKDLLHKCSGIEFIDFVAERYIKMRDIFERVGNHSKNNIDQCNKS